MFEYNINKNADNQSFYKICTRIEKYYPAIAKEKMLVDVDGSMIQVYKKDNKKIIVYNDYEVDAVYIESEIDLNKIFD